MWKLRALYELFGGNSNYTNNSGQFLLNAVIPKDSDSSELELDSNKVTIQYDSNFIENFLIRTRIHRYMDSVLFHSFFSKFPYIYLFIDNDIYSFFSGTLK